MDTETVARVVAALHQANDVLDVSTATKAGISKSTLKRAADKGLILHPGRNRYTTLDAPKRKLAYQGAYLGKEGVLSVRGAQYYWALDGIDELILEWSVPATVRASSPFILRRRNFGRLEVVEHDGILVTSVPQTLLDLGMRCDVDIVERAYECALRKGLIHDIEMREWAEAHGNWHGIATLRAVQARRRPGERPTGSDIETIALQAYRLYGIFPTRQWEVRNDDGIVLGYGDFGHPPKRFITEIDSREFHDDEHRQRDYWRQGDIEDLGYTFRRFTYEDVLYRPAAMCKRTLRGIALARPL